MTDSAAHKAALAAVKRRDAQRCTCHGPEGTCDFCREHGGWVTRLIKELGLDKPKRVCRRRG